MFTRILGHALLESVSIQNLYTIEYEARELNILEKKYVELQVKLIKKTVYIC